MFHTSPFCISDSQRASLSAWRATMPRPRVASTMSLTSVKSGQARSTFAPRPRNTARARSATAATSWSTGISPLRSGVHATRQPLTEGRFTAAVNCRVSTS